MLDKTQFEAARLRALTYFDKAGIILTDKEKQSIEIADFGLGDLEKIGLEVLVYVNTTKVCAKELIMFPGQTCPEHIHPTKNGIPGKHSDAGGERCIFMLPVRRIVIRNWMVWKTIWNISKWPMR
jgi:D-lyxose ketol-isomerase